MDSLELSNRSLAKNTCTELGQKKSSKPCFKYPDNKADFVYRNFREQTIPSVSTHTVQGYSQSLTWLDLVVEVGLEKRESRRNAVVIDDRVDDLGGLEDAGDARHVEQTRSEVVGTTIYRRADHTQR